jgi:hypothetical protein
VSAEPVNTVTKRVERALLVTGSEENTGDNSQSGVFPQRKTEKGFSLINLYLFT